MLLSSLQTSVPSRPFLAGIGRIILLYLGLLTGCLVATAHPIVPKVSKLSQADLPALIAQEKLLPISTAHPHPNLSRTLYQQYYDGLKVIGARVVVRQRAGDVSISSTMLSGSLFNTLDVVSPQIDRTTAIQTALRVAPDRVTVSEASIDPVILSIDGSLHLVWQVMVDLSKPLQLLEVIVDAHSGEVLLTENKLQRLDIPGRVFIPDPKSFTGDSTLRDQNDSAEAIPENAYSDVTLRDVSQSDSGAFYLTGPFADTSPTTDRACADSAGFLFERDDHRFEETMAYYYIDSEARYIRSLGFDDVPPCPQQVNTDGSPDDASYFNPRTGIITTGTGGVDDAEDADVLIHEYGHSLIERIIPDWRGGETPLLIEGFCDYLAGDYSLSVAPDYYPEELYNWDGHNEYWAGRRLDQDYHYPEDAGRERHDAGQLWSATLFDVLRTSGDRDNWNRVVIDAIYSLTDSATVPEAAEAILASDFALTGGSFHQLFLDACESRGILRGDEDAPVIVHRPLKDTERIRDPRRVEARVYSRYLLTPDATQLHYSFDDVGFHTSILTQDQGDSAIYVGYIPATNDNRTVHYYFTAMDEFGGVGRLPLDPDTSFSYYAGPDTIRPIILELDTIQASVFRTGETNFAARATDNVGVSRIYLEIEAESDTAIELTSSGDSSDTFFCRLNWSCPRRESVSYTLWVQDSSNNISLSNKLNFGFTNSMLVDNFERPSFRWQSVGFERSRDVVFDGEWACRDRGEGAVGEREATLFLDETWRLAGLERPRLIFAERHVFDRQSGEYAAFEVSSDSGNNWERLLTMAGWQQDWTQREVNLDRWAGEGGDPIFIRFRSSTPEGAGDFPGLYLDNIWLQVGNPVDVRSPGAPVVWSLGQPYPNPTNGLASVSYSLHLDGTLSLYDSAGRVLRDQPLSAGTGRFTIDLKDLPSGTYYLTPNGTILPPRPITLIK